MSARVLNTLLPRLRHEPSRKRVRAELGGEVVVDSTEAVLVWEPHRVIPAYAVPREHVHGELPPAPAGAEPAEPLGFRLADGLTVLDPSVPFAVHSTDGEPLSLSAAGQTREGVAFRPADPDLAGHVVLDFDGFDAWYEEDEQIVVHPRDPFHRLDILPSSRHVRVELDGQTVAESRRPLLLLETGLPARWYLPRIDVRQDALRPSHTVTACPYKGRATYVSVDSGQALHGDIAWTYAAPIPECPKIEQAICFFNEHVDLEVDGEPQERPVTAWSRAR